MECCWECQVLSCLGRALSTGICNGTSHQDGWITSHPWVRGNYSVSTGVAWSCCKPELLKCTIPEMEHAPLEEGRSWGPSLAYPTLSLSPHTWWCCLPLPTCVIHTTRSTSWSRKPSSQGQVDWTHSVLHWYDHLTAVFLPSIGLEDIIAYVHRKPCIFT